MTETGIACAASIGGSPSVPSNERPAIPKKVWKTSGSLPGLIGGVREAGEISD